MYKAIAVTPFLLIALGALTSCRSYAGADTIDKGKERFAQCLTDKGTRLFVTSWCGACRAQKRLFGPDAWAKLAVTQCDDPNRPGFDHPDCARNRIEYVPTWIFRDGRRLSGVQKFKALGEYTGCPPP